MRHGTVVASGALNPTGALSAILFTLALLATPLRYFWPRSSVVLWLVINRRYLGVASFGYALLHTLLYLLETGSTAIVIAEMSRLDFASGWVSLLVMAPLALTSSDRWVRSLGHRWKILQRWAYGAAVLGLLHAISLNDWHDPWEALFIAAPLIALQALRLYRYFLKCLKHR
ncbi:MAG: ferric reductase-like transmembrane domain-containing protein [Paracoccaceae bacterium]